MGTYINSGLPLPQWVPSSLIERMQVPPDALKQVSPELAALIPDAVRFISDALKKSGAVFLLDGQLVPSEQLPDFLKAKGLSPQQQGAIVLHLFSSMKDGTLPLPSSHGSAIEVNEPLQKMATPLRTAKFIAGLERAAKQKNPMALLEGPKNAAKGSQFLEPHKAYSDPVNEMARAKKVGKTRGQEAPSAETRIANLPKLLEGTGIDPKVAKRAIEELKVLYA